MSDDVGKRRGNPNWGPNGSGAGRNVRGPKPKHESFAEKVRAAISDDELIAFAVNAIRNPKTPWREAVQLHSYLTTRAHGSVPTVLDLNVGTQPQFQLPSNWRYLSPADQDAWIDDLARERLPAGDDDVIDV